MKKFYALFIIFFFLILQGNLYAEKKGAEIVIQKRGGLNVRGELIAVKEDSLLLMERESGSDVSVDIREIRTIVIVKKPKLNYGFFGGLLVGGALGGYLGVTMYGPREEALAVMLGALGAAAFATLGGFIFGSASPGETIYFYGKSEPEIQDILEKLRNMARVRNLQ
jgi:hypothetical protein